jgi:hypothetical protein
VFTADRSTKEEPCYIPAASPRLPRSTSPWPPGRQTQTHQGVLPTNQPGRGAHRTRPISTRFGAGDILRDVITQVPRVLLSVTLAGPAPSGSTGTSRLCQGRSHPPPAPPRVRLPSAPPPCCDRVSGEGLSPPLDTAAPHGARVRDVTFAEDHSQTRTAHGPVVMATLRNLTISVHRRHGATNIAAATRRVARHPGRALPLLL